MNSLASHLACIAGTWYALQLAAAIWPNCNLLLAVGVAIVLVAVFVFFAAVYEVVFHPLSTPHAIYGPLLEHSTT